MTTNSNKNTAGQDISFGSRTDIGYVRDHNEDSLIIIPPLFAVADGMGGHEAGEIASEITVNTLAELALSHLDAEGLTAAVEAANYNVMKAPRQGIGRDGMGTTLTAAMLEGGSDQFIGTMLCIALPAHDRFDRVVRDHGAQTVGAKLLRVRSLLRTRR